MPTNYSRKAVRGTKWGDQTQLSEFNRSPFVKKGSTFVCKGCNQTFAVNSPHQSYCLSCTRTTRQKINRRAFKKNKPVEWKARMIYTSLHGYGIKVSTDEIKKWMERTPICIYCLQPIKLIDYSPDHIIPRSRGGEDKVENIQLVCKSCNQMKGRLLDSEFRSLLDFLKDKPEMYAIMKQRLKSSGAIYW